MSNHFYELYVTLYCKRNYKLDESLSGKNSWKPKAGKKWYVKREWLNMVNMQNEGVSVTSGGHGKLPQDRTRCPILGIRGLVR